MDASKYSSVPFIGMLNIHLHCDSSLSRHVFLLTEGTSHQSFRFRPAIPERYRCTSDSTQNSGCAPCSSPGRRNVLCMIIVLQRRSWYVWPDTALFMPKLAVSVFRYIARNFSAGVLFYIVGRQLGLPRLTFRKAIRSMGAEYVIGDGQLDALVRLTRGGDFPKRRLRIQTMGSRGSFPGTEPAAA